MSKYESLSEAYASYLAAEQLYLQRLTSVAGDVADGFDRYLGRSRRDSVVRLGIGNEHNFEEAQWLDLTCTRKVVDFSLAVTMREPSGLGRTTHVVFQIGVSRTDGVYTFALKDFSDPVLISDLDISEKRFDPIYDQLCERLLKIYDPQYYLS